MSTISAADVNKLRQLTGAGMMDCKKALTETNGDFDAAVDYLRKKGQKISAARADRDAKEGAVIAKTSADKKTGVVILLACETDFVAKNDDFVAFANEVADLALANKPADLDALKALTMGSVTLAERLMEQVGKIGEKVDVTRYEILEGDNLVPYIHAGNRLGVLVSLTSAANEANFVAGKDVAMQIAALNPLALDKGDVDASVVAREIEVAKEQVRAEGKPENMIEKIAEGKLGKFYKESTLLNQEFVKDSSKTIAQMLDGVEKGLSVKAFKRVALG
ncbi:elongation factor Ts [Bacteroidetes bacterium UKL13-3]|jgi:elongation factor Ts|nr:elongation factor Ts [Bacteroidetes bacterium UKL13-3]HCP93061.1 elongation factor Ts [Bacteroidota bacterium]